MIIQSLSDLLEIAGITLTNLEYDKFQAEWVALYKLRVGDTVHVIRHAASFQYGWRCRWVSEMDDYVGESYEVEEITEYGITIEGYSFPFFVLQVVGKQYPDQPVLRIPLQS